MQSTTYVSLSQQSALSRAMDVLANDMANLSTPAFKIELPIAKEYPVKLGSGQTVSYVEDVGVWRDTRQGDLTYTANPLDTAIQGNGYYSVQTPNGLRYTRNGRFQIGAGSQLVTSQGYPILNNRGAPITVPANPGQLVISADGTIVTAKGTSIGKLGVSKFAEREQLVSQEDGLYVTDAQPTPDTDSQVKQGMIENSNAEPIVLLTKLMAVQRAYSDAQSMADGEDTRIRNAIDKLSAAG
jgi:flagellar basal-body rod protein FlgF